MATLQQMITPLSADIVERAMHTDFISDFIAAADLIYTKPAAPYLAVNDAIDAAVEEWADDNRRPGITLSAEQRDRIASELTARGWRAWNEGARAVPIDDAFDAFCQANDFRRKLRAEAWV